MVYTRNMSESHKIIDVIAPVSASTEQTGTWVAVGQFRKFLALFQTGAIAATGTIDFKVQQARNAAGSGAKDLVVAETLTDDDDNKYVALEFKAEDLDDGFSYVRLVADCAEAASLVAGVLFAFESRYEPV